MQEKFIYENKLEKLKSKFPFIGDIRGKGLLIGIEFVENSKPKTPFSRKATYTQKVITLPRKKDY